MLILNSSSFMFNKKTPDGSQHLEPGFDPIIGQDPTNHAKRDTVGLNPQNQTQSYSVPQLVIAKGGEYFFMPSIPALSTVIAA